MTLAGGLADKMTRQIAVLGASKPVKWRTTARSNETTKCGADGCGASLAPACLSQNSGKAGKRVCVCVWLWLPKGTDMP